MNVLVFDTETVGMRTQTLLNVGYKIVDINPSTGEISKELVKRDYIVRDHFNNDLLMINDMFVGVEKWEKMKQNVANGGAILRSTEQIFATMSNDIEKHKPLFGYAYNCDFDIARFTETADRYGITNPIGALTIYDLWSYAYNHICVNDDYVKYMKEHELYTDSGRFIRTSVEGVTAFLNQNPDFVEDHTALSDVEWELRILQEVIRRGCDITKPMRRGKNIASGKIFKKTFIIDGQTIEVEYTKTIGKLDGDIVKFVKD